jgi:hypothetical protein
MMTVEPNDVATHRRRPPRRRRPWGASPPRWAAIAALAAGVLALPAPRLAAPQADTPPGPAQPSPAQSLSEWAASLPSELPVRSPNLQRRWQAWRAAAGRPDLLGPGGAGDDLDDRRLATTAVRDALTTLDGDLVAPDDPPRPASVAAAVAAHREAELAALSSGLVAGLGPPLGPSPDERKACAAAFARWVADLSALADDLRVSGPMAGAIWTLDDLTDRPDRRARWVERLSGDLDVLPEAAAVRARLDALAALITQSRAALLAAAKGGTTFERRYGAWQALTRAKAVNPQWLTQPGDLALDDGIREGLAALGPVVPAGLPAEAEVKQRWLAFAGGVGDEARAREAIDSLAKRAGRPPAGHPPAGPPPAGRSAAGRMLDEAAAVQPVEPRFNVLLRLARHLLASPPPLAADADLAAVRAALAATVNAWPADRRGPADLRRRLDEREPFVGQATKPTFDLPLPGGGVVTFIRATARGGRAFYLSADEVTLGQFSRALRPATRPGEPAAAPSAQVTSLLRAADPRVAGPRVWRVGGPPDELSVSVAPPSGKPRWLPEGRNDYADDLRDPAFDNRELLDPAAGGLPTENHPMQQVPAAAALLAALLVDCRLPTTAEWAQATEVPPPAGAPAAPVNLRDPTWAKQWRYVDARRQAGKANAAYPDEGAFVPAGLNRAVLVGAAARPAVDSADRAPDDRTLYFLPAAPPAQPPRFRNLVGNVAELAFEAPEALAGLQATDKSRLVAAEVEAMLRDNPSKLRVIGLSAMSAPQLRQAEPYPIDPTATYADVGFRLAFTAPFATEAERLQWVLQNQPYLPLAAGRP